MELNSLMFLFAQRLENQTREKHAYLLQCHRILMDNLLQWQLSLIEYLFFSEKSIFLLIRDSNEQIDFIV